MSEFLNVEETRQVLRQLTVIAFDANRALQAGLQSPAAEPPPERSAVMSKILENLKLMREGFMLSSRASDLTLAAELRILLDYLMDWEWLQEIGLRWNTDASVEHLQGQVILYHHAVIALAMLPRLPDNAVTYPYGKYADIPVPATPI